MHETEWEEVDKCIYVYGRKHVDSNSPRFS